MLRIRKGLPGRKWGAVGLTRQEQHEGTFWGEGNGLHLALGGGYCTFTR